MELALFVYLASIAGGLNGFFVAISVISAITCLVILLVSTLTESSTWDCETDGISKHQLTREEYSAACKRGSTARLAFRRKVVWPLLVFLFFGVLTSLTPDNEKQVYLIGGAWALQSVGEKTINSDTADLAVKAVNAKLQQYITESATPAPAPAAPTTR